MKSERQTLMIGDALKLIRQEREMTQEELADRTRSVVGFISAVETGRKRVSLGSVEVFAKALNVPASFLLLLSDSSRDPRIADLKQFVLGSLSKARSEKKRLERDPQPV